MKAQAYEDVLIDVCPSCRGVWLDRGELQKIVAHVREQERGEADEILPAPAPRPEPAPEGRSRKGRKKKSKLGGLWDFLEDIID
jgi:Zn-finger nucleic acid-binding protein